MNKRILLLPLCMCLLTGCGSRDGGRSTSTLKIGCVEMGYGTKWLSAIIDAYTKKTGIKVELTTEPGQSGMSKLNTIVDSGDPTYDLIFNKRGAFEHDCIVGKVSLDGKTYDSIFIDITDVYNSVVDPNTDKTIHDKMIANYADYYSFNGHYYGLPWANGLMGIVRNKTLWDSKGFKDEDVPMTTNELFSLCDRINNTESISASPFIYSAEDEYYTGWCNIFLAQYMGVDEFTNTVLEGISPSGKVDENFFTHDGMLETLQVMGELLDPENEYQHPDSKQLKFTAMQSQFLGGAAFFNVNGSWLEVEMGSKTTYDEIDYIKTPIISAISNKLSIGVEGDSNYIEDETARDKKLSDIVKYVDKGATGLKPTKVTDDDIETVKQARAASFVESGLDHQAFIPCVAKNVNGAKDFLKFMYSDEGLNVYYETMRGATLPANPSTGKYNKDLTKEMSTFRKSIYKVINEQQIVRMQSKAKFFRLGDLNHWYSNSGIQAISRLADGAKVDTKNTPERILEDNDSYLKNHWDTIKDKIK